MLCLGRLRRDGRILHNTRSATFAEILVRYTHPSFVNTPVDTWAGQYSALSAGRLILGASQLLLAAADTKCRAGISPQSGNKPRINRASASRRAAVNALPKSKAGGLGVGHAQSAAAEADALVEGLNKYTWEDPRCTLCKGNRKFGLFPLYFPSLPCK